MGIGSIGIALGAGTKGWFEGVEKRHSWEDRDEQKKRQKWLDAFTEKEEGRKDDRHGWAGEQQGWAADQHGWAGETHEQNTALNAQRIDQQGRVLSDDDARRADAAAAAAATDAAMAGRGGGLGAATVSTMGAPAEGGAAAPVTAIAAPDAPALALPREVADSLAPRITAALKDAGVADQMTPDTIRNTATAVQEAIAAGADPDAAVQQAVAGIAPPPPAQQQASAPAPGTATGMPLMPPGTGQAPYVAPPAAAKAPAGLGAAQGPSPLDVIGSGAPARAQIEAGIEHVGDSVADMQGLAVNSGKSAANAVAVPFNTIMGGLGSTQRLPVSEHGETLPGRTAKVVGKGLGLAIDAIAGKEAGKEAAKSDAPPAAEARTAASAAEAAVEAAVPNATPAAEIAKGASKTTGMDEITDRAAATWSEEWLRTGAPMVQRGMIERGDYQSAQEFDTFVNTQATQEGMKRWGKAAASAAMGDFGGFKDNFIAAYNTQGYYEDGYKIVADESDFIRGEDGSITGAAITFENEDTGEIFVRKFEDMEDMVQFGLEVAGPGAAFEAAKERIAAQTKAQEAFAIDAQARADAINKEILLAAKGIHDSEAKNSLPGSEVRDWGEIVDEARARVLGLYGGEVEPEGEDVPDADVD